VFEFGYMSTLSVWKRQQGGQKKPFPNNQKILKSVNEARV